MLPSSIDESGQLFKDNELIADVECSVSVSEGGLMEWKGTMEITEKHSPKSMNLADLGKIDLNLENYQGKIFVTNQRLTDQGIVKISFTGAEGLEEI